MWLVVIRQGYTSRANVVGKAFATGEDRFRSTRSVCCVGRRCAAGLSTESIDRAPSQASCRKQRRKLVTSYLQSDTIRNRSGVPGAGVEPTCLTARDLKSGQRPKLAIADNLWHARIPRAAMLRVFVGSGACLLQLVPQVSRASAVHGDGKPEQGLLLNR